MTKARTPRLTLAPRRLQGDVLGDCGCHSGCWASVPWKLGLPGLTAGLSTRPLRAESVWLHLTVILCLGTQWHHSEGSRESQGSSLLIPPPHPAITGNSKEFPLSVPGKKCKSSQVPSDYDKSPICATLMPYTCILNINCFQGPSRIHFPQLPHPWRWPHTLRGPHGFQGSELGTLCGHSLFHPWEGGVPRPQGIVSGSFLFAEARKGLCSSGDTFPGLLGRKEVAPSQGASHLPRVLIYLIHQIDVKGRRRGEM